MGVRGLPFSATGILGDWPSGGVFTKETERRILVCNESVFHEISTEKEKSLGLGSVPYVDEKWLNGESGN